MSFDRFLAGSTPGDKYVTENGKKCHISANILAWNLIITTAIPVAFGYSVRIYQFHGHDYTACVFSSDKEVWSLLGFQI
ncbi:Allatostatin-A receptor [Lucilia cuprina]|nr:Allatostatin-A receptor [Lucilia cuprina]